MKPSVYTKTPRRTPRKRAKSPNLTEDEWESSDREPPPRTPSRIAHTPTRSSNRSSQSSRRRTARQPMPLSPAPSTRSQSGNSPTVPETLYFLLLPLRILLAPIAALFSPFISHAINLALIICFSIITIYFLPSILSTLISRLLSPLSNALWGLLLPDQYRALPSDIAFISLSVLSTPSCALLGLACPYSLLSDPPDVSGGTQAKPFWRWIAPHAEESQLDVARVAQVLTTEVRRARDIFDSVRLLGENQGSLEYVRVWELGAALSVRSQSDEGREIGKRVGQLGDQARDLMDELNHIDAVSVNDFSWIQWEFSRLLLSLSPTTGPPPTQSQLSTKLHTLLLSLTSTLDNLHSLTSTTSILATHSSTLGRDLSLRLNGMHESLWIDDQHSPFWRKALDKSSHLIAGGPPSKAELISRDLQLTQQTIMTISTLVRDLETTRLLIKGFRDQVGMFDASLMGWHLGVTSFEENDSEGISSRGGEGGGLRLSPEEEIRILNDVISGFGQAIGRAKLGTSGHGSGGGDGVGLRIEGGK